MSSQTASDKWRVQSQFELYNKALSQNPSVRCFTIVKYLTTVHEHLSLISSTATKTVTKPNDPPLQGMWDAFKYISIGHLCSVFLSRR